VNSITLLVALLAFVAGAAAVFLLLFVQRKREVKQASTEAQQILDRANRRAERVRTDAELEAKEKLLSAKKTSEKEWKAKRKELARQENDLANREQNLERDLLSAKNRLKEVQKGEQSLSKRLEAMEKDREEVDTLLKSHRTKLEEIAGLTAAEAKSELLRQMEYDARREATRIIKKVEENARDRAKSLARIITTQAVEKVVPNTVSEGSVSVVRLPSEEMKGRVIGREGRNIRTFERVTGVDVIVDDTPEIIMLACHNPMRRMVAQKALEMLVEDGRIHPGRIEEFVDKAREQMDEQIFERGRDALYALGIHNMPERLVILIGRMSMRMTHGQNLLEHSLETAKIAMYMAQALDANVEVCKRAGILHEVGHIEEHTDDTHPTLLAAQLARRFGEDPQVVSAIAHLHPDHPSTLPEAHLLETAENLALAAPGVHKEGLERYIQHLESLEQMVMGFKGVKKVYAMKAGRELLVLVDTEMVDDEYTVWLAKDISERIEREVRFTGQVKVQVVRETRYSDFAT